MPKINFKTKCDIIVCATNIMYHSIASTCPIKVIIIIIIKMIYLMFDQAGCIIGGSNTISSYCVSALMHHVTHGIDLRQHSKK